MCIRIVERYAICGCIYHIHSVDACAFYGRHQIVDRLVRVGYTCTRHCSGRQ
ncbi:hypothetical protein K490DRAFT_41321 [Saccharata proteae CBS 121410]|uniref:Uncharacterized protein n=1 Tax=Saccharata proteae CBS 121410 TaxID=1314787 RepID=A0A9P4HT55_9PEZI|nr:hypothetical protein K490DRAFT_41321 [Saccharata proteae CBS 121410]